MGEGKMKSQSDILDEANTKMRKLNQIIDNPEAYRRYLKKSKEKKNPKNDKNER